MGLGSRSASRLTVCIIIASVTCLGFAGPAPRPPPPPEVPRPVQYVALAFDGSKSVPMWNETRAFAKDMTARGKPLKFTYFINADYYLANEYKMSYVAPGLGAGKSAIGFGEKVDDVLKRFDQTNFAYKEGHEIANHAAGHFDGSKWTAAEWTSEFTQFFDLIFNVFKFNHALPTASFPAGWVFNPSEMIGFRAPQLGQNAALFETLPKYGIQYDTSLTASSDYWPHKNAQGIWNFPLSSIPIAGTAKKTLSMDYNFYYSQSDAKEDPAKGPEYEEQMYRSYLAYFQQNYNGNRAPINIGHHFAQWNGGAYWRAEKHFAETVCGLPEVKCVTYRDLVAFMNTVDAPTLAAYAAGRFIKAGPLPLPVRVADRVQFLDVQVTLATNGAGEIKTTYAGRDLDRLAATGQLTQNFWVNQQLLPGADLKMNDVRARSATGSMAHVEARLFYGAREIQKISYLVHGVGTAQESLVQEENPGLIADPPEAHSEFGADDVAWFH